MATWNRGRHILPSVRSVLAQSFRDFELLVVGDACTDDTEQVVCGVQDSRVRWINLEQRWGAQSGPNNEGIAQARGSIIAYLGHDDVWDPDYLETAARSYDRGGVDAVISGLIGHGPPGSGNYRVHGLFDNPDDARIYFFPPSGLTHTRKIGQRAGPWPRKEEAGRPVDTAYELSLVEAGCRFVSTGEVRVHKIAAVSRYLSYVFPDSSEQEALLARLLGDSDRSWVDEIVKGARGTDRFLPLKHAQWDHRSGAEVYRNMNRHRGLDLPPLRPLGRVSIIAQDGGPRAADWHGLRKKDNGVRWAGPSATPRLLIPVTHPGSARFSARVLARGDVDASTVEVYAPSDGVEASWSRRGMVGRHHRLWQVSGQITLSPDGYSCLEFHHPKAAMTRRPNGALTGLGVGSILLWPEGGRLGGWLSKFNARAAF